MLSGVTGSVFRSLRAAALLTGALVVLQTGLASAAAPVPQSLIEQRALVMQGLSIGLGLVTLGSQANAVVFSSILSPDQCWPLTDAGSIKLVSSTRQGQVQTAQVRIYFDGSCSSIYMDETFVLADKGEYFRLDATIKIFSAAGKQVATLKLANNKLVTGDDGAAKLFGLGELKPAGRNSTVVKLGLSCGFPPPSSPKSGPAKASESDCQGASAQDFKLLNRSIGAVTKTTLVSANSGRITFRQTEPGTIFTGALGALSVKISPQGSLSIAGNKQTWSTDTLTGGVGRLVVFTRKPAAWKLTDASKKARFSIEKTSNSTHVSKGLVETLSGKELASFEIDQSGSGGITYSNGVKAKIASWVLLD